MILDYIQNIGTYINFNRCLADGFSFIEKIKNMPVGRYEQGDMYAFVQEGLTNPGEFGNFESHREYCDFQCMVEGEEILEWNDTTKLDEIISYDENKDTAFYSGSGNKVLIERDMFYILFPHDAHKCCMHVDKQTRYRKVVLKLKI